MPRPDPCIRCDIRPAVEDDYCGECLSRVRMEERHEAAAELNDVLEDFSERLAGLTIPRSLYEQCRELNRAVATLQAKAQEEKEACQQPN